MTNSQKEQIRQLRIKGGSYVVIGEKLHLSKDTIKTFCRRNDISSGSSKKSETMSGRCRECGAKLIQTKKRKQKVFCSQSCREKKVAFPSGQNQSKGCLQFSVCRLRKAIHSLRQQPQKILLS